LRINWDLEISIAFPAQIFLCTMTKNLHYGVLLVNHGRTPEAVTITNWQLGAERLTTCRLPRWLQQKYENAARPA
jgi:hypothetical protein